jgi:DNA-binding NarL/FixJ family response regulator
MDKSVAVAHTAAMPCSALIVDDNEDMAFLVASTIEVADDGLTVAGTVLRAEDVLAQVRSTSPDVVVMDYLMPGRNGLEVAADILAERPDQDIVLFSANLDRATLVAAEHIGIRECVSKEQVRDLPDIIRKYGAT